MDAPREEGLIFGLAEIGRRFGKSRWTIRRWIDNEAFPACRLPDGKWVTDPELIRRWILARQEVDREIAEGLLQG